MIEHEEIWNGIDRLADAYGYSPSGLAKKAGLDPTSFNKSKRISADGKPRWPTTESIAKILSVTGATMSDFIGLTGAEESSAPPKKSSKIPVLGLAKAGRKGYFDEDGAPSGNGWDEIDFPDKHVRHGNNVYGLKVTGNSMEPLYRDGDLLIVAPGANVRRGDRVVVKTRKGEVMAKEIVKQSSSRIELASLNPDHKPLSLSQGEIGWIARILWVSQ